MRRVVWTIVGLATAFGLGCGTARRVDTLRDQATQSFADAVARKDVAAIASQLGDPVAYGGLWFADAECTRQFPVAMTIEAHQRDAFARCLATLPLRETNRRSQIRTVSLFEYQPGLEVAVAFRMYDATPTVGWIGYSGRRELRDGLPSVVPSALTSHRLAGNPAATPTPAMAATITTENAAFKIPHAYAWLNVCIDATGRVTGVHNWETSTPTAQAAFIEAIRDWRFRPFMLGGQPSPVCSLVLLTYPPIHGGSEQALPRGFPAQDGAINVAARLLKRIEGETRIVPDDDDKRRIGRRAELTAAFQLCIDETGRISKLLQLEYSGLPRYDGKLLAAVSQWKYEPLVIEGKPVTACTIVVFNYTQRRPR
ncbi:MAG: hypothetical protein AB7O24_20920 [Kofleriaceae bacterium]